METNYCDEKFLINWLNKVSLDRINYYIEPDVPDEYILDGIRYYIDPETQDALVINIWNDDGSERLYIVVYLDGIQNPEYLFFPINNNRGFSFKGDLSVIDRLRERIEQECDGECLQLYMNKKYQII